MQIMLLVLRVLLWCPSLCIDGLSALAVFIVHLPNLACSLSDFLTLQRNCLNPDEEITLLLLHLQGYPLLSSITHSIPSRFHLQEDEKMLFTCKQAFMLMWMV